MNAPDPHAEHVGCDAAHHELYEENLALRAALFRAYAWLTAQTVVIAPPNLMEQMRAALEH
jgi:hypothetical protein